ncbi:hypothetical protein SESBI_16932 [Sesbania bispinosa]|nr:hypothetical protein SESBI_16932 [Sesbania bispinosa]
MAELLNECIMLKDIGPNILKPVTRARVNRLWSVPNMKIPLEINSVEIVLVDSQGCKIQATILRELVNIFQSNIVEEGSYIFCDFDVVRNVGSYKPTRHPFKILFKEGTVVKPTEPDFVVNYCVSPMANWEIRNFKAHLDYLVDVIGVVTTISPEKEFGYGIGAKKYVSLEVTDYTGKVECMLFDEYITLVKDYLKFCGRPRPIIVIQYARVIPLPGPVFGEIVVQNYYNATRVMFNGAIPEVMEFKKRIAALGMAYEDKPTTFSQGTVEIPMKDDFLVLNSRKRIGELQVCKEAGVFVILARVVGFMETGRWWYYACKCNRPAFPKNDVFYCPGCCKLVANVIHRYMIKVKVYDGDKHACFRCFDVDIHRLLKKSCKDLLNDVQAEPMRGIEFFPLPARGNLGKGISIGSDSLDLILGLPAKRKNYGEGPLCYDGDARCEVIKPGGEGCSKTMEEIVSFKKEPVEDGEHVGDPTVLKLSAV